MDENKKDNIDAKKAKDQKAEKRGFAEWFGGITGEFKRINWPGKNELAKMTVTVILTSAIFGGIIVLYDLALTFGYDSLYGLFN